MTLLVQDPGYHLMKGEDINAIEAAVGDASAGRGAVIAAGTSTARTVAARFADVHNAADWGVIADGKQLTSVNSTSGSAVVSCPAYQFTAADVGAAFILTTSAGALATTGTIVGVSGGTATLSANAQATISDGTGRMTFYHTDNTAALQAALNGIAAQHADANGHNATGFKLVLPDGVIATKTISLPRFCVLASAGGPQATTLFGITGTNGPVVTSENFATLTGTGAVYGINPNVPAWFGLQDLHIDGNGPGQTTGNCVSFYGSAQLMLGSNLFENAKVDNIYTEGAGGFAASATDWRTQEEGLFEHVTSRNAGRYGWLNRGPHDSVIISVISNENGSTNYRCEQSGTTYVGSAHIHSIHTYTSYDGTGQYYGASTTIQEAYSDFDNVTIDTGGVEICRLTQIQGGTAGLNLLEVTPNATYWNIGTHSMNFQPTAANIVGVNVQAGGGPGTIGNSMCAGIPGSDHITLYKIRSNFFTLNTMASNADGTGSVGIDLNAAFCRVTGQMFNCVTGLAYGGGNNNYIQLGIYLGSGTTAYTGAFNGSDTVLITGSDGTLVNQLPGILPIPAAGGVSLGYGAYAGAGVQNVLVGGSAGSGLSGFNNTGVGYSALSGAGFRQGCVGLGVIAGSAITSGSYNTVLGPLVGSTTLSTGSHVLLLGTGAEVDTPATSTSNWINIENTIVGQSSRGTSPGLGILGVRSQLGVLKGANFNSSADQAITISHPITGGKYLITDVIATNASASLTTAAGGLYTAASKGGTVLVASGQAYTNCSTATGVQRLTLATGAADKTYTATTQYLSLTTPQGAAATADVYVFGVPLA